MTDFIVAHQNLEELNETIQSNIKLNVQFRELKNLESIYNIDTYDINYVKMLEKQLFELKLKFWNVYLHPDNIEGNIIDTDLFRDLIENQKVYDNEISKIRKVMKDIEILKQYGDYKIVDPVLHNGYIIAEKRRYYVNNMYLQQVLKDEINKIENRIQTNENIIRNIKINYVDELFKIKQILKS